MKLQQHKNDGNTRYLLMRKGNEGSLLSFKCVYKSSLLSYSVEIQVKSVTVIYKY